MAKIRYYASPARQKNILRKEMQNGVTYHTDPSHNYCCALLVTGAAAAVPPLHNRATLHYERHCAVTVTDAGIVRLFQLQTLEPLTYNFRSPLTLMQTLYAKMRHWLLNCFAPLVQVRIRMTSFVTCAHKDWMTCFVFPTVCLQKCCGSHGHIIGWTQTRYDNAQGAKYLPRRVQV